MTDRALAANSEIASTNWDEDDRAVVIAHANKREQFLAVDEHRADTLLTSEAKKQRRQEWLARQIAWMELRG